MVADVEAEIGVSPPPSSQGAGSGQVSWSFVGEGEVSEPVILVCKGTIEKDCPGRTYVLWRRRCKAKTSHESGYCRFHRVSHTTRRK